MKSKGIVH